MPVFDDEALHHAKRHDVLAAVRIENLFQGIQNLGFEGGFCGAHENSCLDLG